MNAEQAAALALGAKGLKCAHCGGIALWAESHGLYRWGAGRCVACDYPGYLDIPPGPGAEFFWHVLEDDESPNDGRGTFCNDPCCTCNDQTQEMSE